MADKNLIYPELLWAGTQHSLDIAFQAFERTLEAGMRSGDDDEDEEEEPYLFSQHDNVAVITIKGSLTNRDSPWNRYFGVTSYNAIREAMVYAAQKPEIKAILLDIDSGGGAVNGVADTGDLISRIDREVKPVYSITDGTMASAAYWLGSSARKVYSSNLALVGSIGVITTHVEYSQQLKEAGIGVTVLRAGEFKALANSYEPLTKPAVEQITAQLQTAYGVFINHVAARRGVTVEVADGTMGQGREFMGQAALGAGLIDGIKTFDSLLSEISSIHVDKSNVTQSQYGKYISTTDPMKTALTTQQIAAIQAGVPVVQAPEGAQPAAPETTSQEPAAQTAPTEPQAATEPAPQQPDPRVSLLSEQLAASTTQLVEARTQLNALQGQVTQLQAENQAAIAIVGQSVSAMRVALGMAAIDVSSLSASTLLSEHASLSGTFRNTFKAGGVAAPSAAAAEQPTADDPMRLRRVKATSFQSR